MSIIPANPQATKAPEQADDPPPLSSSHPALNPSQLIPLPFGAVEKIGDYEILGILGEGAEGIVYKAKSPKDNISVALKRLGRLHKVDDFALMRFYDEADILNELEHPHIVRLFHCDLHDNAPYLVMELVNGGSLAEKLGSKPQPPRKAAEWVEVLARAMHFAHEKDIVHRDLKPKNILLTSKHGDAVLKITDFGIAKRLQVDSGLSGSGGLFGTAAYMAPEQAKESKDVDRKADIYALGAILYEMLTGRTPFVGTSDEILEQVKIEDPEPPSKVIRKKLPRDLEAVCMMCLRKTPTRRYASALELAEDLRCYLDDLPLRHTRWEYSIERVIRRIARQPQRAALVGTGLLAGILAAVLVVTLVNNAIAQGVGKAQQAQEEATQSLNNLKDILRLTTGGDLHTSDGLKSLEEKLKQHEEKGEGSPEIKMVLAAAYHRLATLQYQQGEIDRALDLLGKAEELAAKAEELAGKSEELAKTAAGVERRDLDTQLLLPRIYQMRGYVRADTGSKQAVDDCGRALERLDKLIDERADDPEFNRLRAEALHDRGLAKSRLRLDSAQTPTDNQEEAQKVYDAFLSKCQKEAEDDYKAALELLRKLVDQAETERRARVGQPDASEVVDPNLEDDRPNLVRTLGFLGSLFLDQHRYPEADEFFWEYQETRNAQRTNDGWVRQVETLLRTSINLGFCRLAWEEVAHDCAFSAVAKEDWFVAQLERLKQRRGTQPAQPQTVTASGG